jgi:hypothetical protein
MDIFDSSEEKQSPLIRTAAVISALCVAVALLLGYSLLRQKHVGQEAQTPQTEPAAKNSAPAEANIFEDEARLKGPQAIVGGTVQNITGERLEALTVELELKRRKGGETETRDVRLEPQDLAPGEEGRYSLSVLAREWSGVRVLRLRSGTRAADVAFKSEVGARRPLERTPAGKVVIVPRPKSKGDDFINTPDNPEVIR